MGSHITKAQINKRHQTANQFAIDNLELNKALLVQNNAAIKGEIFEIEKLKKQKLEGSLVPLVEVQELFQEISAQLKAQFLRFISILPPKLEGLEASSMIPVVREEVNAILQNMANGLKFKAPVEEVVAEIIEDEE